MSNRKTYEEITIDERVQNEKKFSKKGLLKSTMFDRNKDVLEIVVKDKEEVTIVEAKRRIGEFLNKEVK